MSAKIAETDPHPLNHWMENHVGPYAVALMAALFLLTFFITVN